MIKNPYLDMRKMMKNMRNAQNGIFETSKTISSNTPKKQLTTRDLLGKMRTLNEETEEEKNVLGVNKKTDFDQHDEETKMTDSFKDLEVVIDFNELEVYDKAVFFSGTIDGQVQWVYTVTPDERSSKFEINYADDYDPNAKENEKILKRIEEYYNNFYRYWRNNIIQKV
jgi:hypothetical protein